MSDRNIRLKYDPNQKLKKSPKSVQNRIAKSFLIKKRAEIMRNDFRQEVLNYDR